MGKKALDEKLSALILPPDMVLSVQCLELLQLFCDHKGKAKRIVGKPAQRHNIAEPVSASLYL